MFEEILALSLEREDPDSVSVVQARYNLATLYSMQGRFAEALEMDRQVLATRRRTHGDDHPTTAIAMSAVAGGLDRAGQSEEALDLYREALAVFESRSPDGSESICDVLMNMGILEKHRGNFAKSTEFSKAALEMRERFSGPNHWSTIKALDDYGLSLQREGRYQEALAVFEEARERGLAHLKATDFVMLPIFTHRAEALRKLQRLDEALAAYREQVAAVESAAIGDHYLAADGRIGLALCLIEIQDEALRDPTEALALARAVHASTSEREADAFAVLGAVEHANGNVEEAIAALEQALEMGLPEEGETRKLLHRLLEQRAAASADGLGERR